MSSFSTAELLTKAADLREMAETARALHTRDALLRLAARYVRLAQERVAQSGADAPIGAWQLSRPATRDENDAVAD